MKPRLLRVTPDRVLGGLLVVEGLLWPAKPWFAKGWAVLTAVATVGVAVLLILLCVAAGWLFGRRFQFQIRSLFVLMLAAAIACDWLVAERERARRQSETVDWIKSLGGAVQYDWNFSADGLTASARRPEPTWLINVLEDDFFYEIGGVQFFRTKVMDADLERLKGLTRVRLADFTDTAIGDAGLEHLRGMPELHWLWVGRTHVTDEGINRLKQAFPDCNVYR